MNTRKTIQGYSKGKYISKPQLLPSPAAQEEEKPVWEEGHTFLTDRQHFQSKLGMDEPKHHRYLYIVGTGKDCCKGNASPFI